MARRTHWLIVLVYACSGVAGLMYQVTWTRLMVLHVVRGLPFLVHSESKSAAV